MAPLPVIPNCFRVALSWQETSTNQIAVNVIHVVSATATSEEVADGVEASFQLNQFYYSVETASIQNIAVTPLDGSSATFNLEATTGHRAGQVSGDFIPQAAIVISFGTALRGRSHRGRVFQPFVGEMSVTNGAMVPANAAQIATSWQAFAAALEAFSPVMTQVVASYKLSEAFGIQSYTVKPAIGTQRRRQERVRYP